MIVKNPDDFERAKELFGDDGINIMLGGERHIGAVIGSEELELNISQKS